MRNRRRKVLGLALFIAALAGISPLMAQENKTEPAGNMPKVGEMAPDFQLGYFDGNELKKVSLDDYRGKKNVVLAFFIFAFTGG